jgi:hypothetical protein
MFGGLGSLSFGGGYDIPYLSIFFRTLVFIAVQFFLLAAIIFGVSKIFKAKNSFRGLIAVVRVASIPVTLTVLASTIIMFILPSLVTILIVFGIIASIIVGTIIVGNIGVSEIINLDEDMNTYIVALSYFAYYFVVFIILFGQARNSVSGIF